MTVPVTPSSEPIARRYRLVAPLGTGGQGHVYRAVDELTGTAVAVKLVEEGKRSGSARREATVLRALRLPGVARLLDEGIWEGQHFLVTELVLGKRFPGRTPPVTWAQLRGPARRLLEAVGQIHRAGVVHGDLKPANVLVEPSGRVRLLDFGMAHARATVVRELAEAPLGGTLHYLAPEVIDGRRPDARSDLFAVGVVLLRSLTDGLPWDADDLRELVAARDRGPARLPSDFGVTVPDRVQRALRELLDVDPQGRPASAVDVLSLLGFDQSDDAFSLPWEAQGPPLTLDQLATAFEGPERILHLPRTAAALLLDATGGHRDRVRDELRAWVAADIAEPVGDRLRVPREALDQLRIQGALPLAVPPSAPGPGDPRARRLLATVAIARQHARPSVLAAALGWSPQELDDLLGRLVASGAASQDPDGRWRDRTAGACLTGLSEGDRIDLHGRVAMALPADEPARLSHLLASGAAAAAVIDAAAAAAAHWLEHGRLGDAMAVAEVAFQLVRNEPYAAGRAAKLVDLYVQAAMASETPPVLAHAAWELKRLPKLPGLGPRSALLSASRSALDGQAEQALELITTLPPFTSDALATLAAVVKIQAGRRLPLEGHVFVLERVQAWVKRNPSPQNLARLAGWLGHLRYRQERFEEAANLHAACARGRVHLSLRIAATLDQARALVEAGRLAEAGARATQARLLAVDSRDPLLEARAWWLTRLVACRDGSADAPDTDLVAAVHQLGVPHWYALTALTEAVIARSRGFSDDAARLAMQAKGGFHAAGRMGAAVLAASLAAECGEPSGLWWARDHFRDAETADDLDLLLQAAALLHGATGIDDWAVEGRRVAARMKPTDQARRRDVMSLDAALQALGARPRDAIGPDNAAPTS